MEQQTRTYTPYAEGIYHLKVKDQALVKAKNNNTYLLLNCEVMSLKKGGDGTRQEYGRNRPVKLHFTAGTIDRSLAFLKAAGFDGDDALQLDPSHDRHISIVGFEFDGPCKHEPWETEQGEKRINDTFGFFAPNGTGWNKRLEKAERPTQSDGAILNSMFGSALKQKSAVSAPETASAGKVPW